MSVAKRDEHAALVALLRTRPEGMSWSDIVAEVVSGGSAMEVWERLVPPTLDGQLAQVDPIQVAAADIAAWQDSSLLFVTVLDDAYPARLRGVHEAPPVLFGRGRLLADDVAVSVVGSRKASDRGRAIATDVAANLAKLGVTVVSGLALGVDAAAHRAALDAGGRTVALIGTGINKHYPAANRELQEEIATAGLVLSQFWPDAPPQKHTFLMRNATMSGYGIATVVVEAGETSGARAQARIAVGHGRPVILTDLVVDRNQWARELVRRPGVYVASSLHDLIDVVKELRAPHMVEQEISRLVAT